MGFDCGFDIYPRLEAITTNQETYQCFLDEIVTTFVDVYDDAGRRTDGKVLDVSDKTSFRFMIGECPSIPKNPRRCSHFLRFSSKVSGRLTSPAEPYIRNVYIIASKHFGSRVHFWHELRETDDERQHGHYSWQQIHDADRELKRLETGQEDLSDPAFEIRALRGRGQGLIARWRITTGERILCEKPLFATTGSLPPEQMQFDVANKLKGLTRSEQRWFLSLHNNFPGRLVFAGIVKTNALPCGPESTVGGIYSNICRINHSCLPNAHHSWNEDAQHETIHAIQEILPGDEITISYDNGETFARRQVRLSNAFGFKCQCSLCSSSDKEIQASDDRRGRIKELDGAIGDGLRVMDDPEACLSDCGRMLRLLQEEYGNSACVLLARLYYDAFQICITHGDQARASVFVERAYQARISCEGEDSPETKRMKNLAAKPFSHRNAGASQRWKTHQKMRPDGLDAVEFEKWLWKQGR